MEYFNDQSTFTDYDWSEFVNFDPDSLSQPDVDLCNSAALPNIHTDLETQRTASTSSLTIAKSVSSLPKTLCQMSGSETGTISYLTAQDSAQNSADEQRYLQKEADDDLTAKIEQLHQAVQRNHKRKAALSDDNVALGKFRVKLSAANREMDVPKLKKTRMKRSEQRTCLWCRACKKRVSRLQKASTTTDSVTVFAWAVLHSMC